MPLTAKQRQVLTCLMADAFYETRELPRAESLYQEALQLCTKKHGVPAKGVAAAAAAKVDDTVCPDGTSEVDIKYKLHLCYLRTNQHNLAAEILQSIPAKQRTPKVYQALGKVYQQGKRAFRSEM